MQKTTKTRYCTQDTIHLKLGFGYVCRERAPVGQLFWFKPSEHSIQSCQKDIPSHTKYCIAVPFNRHSVWNAIAYLQCCSS